MDRLSYSQLQTLASCPEQYRLERIVGVPRQPAWALIGGSAVHTWSEHYDFACHGVNVPAESFTDILERLTVEAEVESGVDRSQFRASGRASKEWPNKENFDWWVTNGQAMCMRWVNFTKNMPWALWLTTEGKPAVEIEFNLLLDEARVDVKGFIDRVYQDADGSLIVLDLKTGASKPPTPRQLGGYKVALQEKFPGARVKYGTFWDARTGSTGELIPLNEFTRERLVYQYGVVKEIRRKGLYLPAPSNMCGSCSVNQFCYEWGGARAGEVRPPWVPLDEWEDRGGE